MKPGDLIITTFPDSLRRTPRPYGMIIKYLGKMRQNGMQSHNTYYLVMTREGKIIDFCESDIELFTSASEES